MKRHRQLPAFGVTFLDLLSGALGAVILLYVIVPKLPVTLEEFEAQQELAAELQRLELSIEALGDLLPPGDLADVRERLDRMEESRARMERALETRERERAALSSELEEVREALGRAESQVLESNRALADLEMELQACQAEGENCDGEEEIEGDQRFIMANLDWNTELHDVDLHVVDPDGNEFYFAARTFPGVPGELTLDNTCGPGFEVWQVIDPTPGTYRIYANLFARMGHSCNAEGVPSGDSPVRLRVFHRNGVQTVETTLTEEGADSKVLVMTAEVDEHGHVVLNPAF